MSPLFVVLGGKQTSARNASSRFLQSETLPPSIPPPPPPLTVPAEREHPACDVCACFFFSFSCQKSHEAPGPRLLLPRRNFLLPVKTKTVSLRRCRILLVIFSHCDRRRECFFQPVRTAGRHPPNPPEDRVAALCSCVAALAR